MTVSRFAGTVRHRVERVEDRTPARSAPDHSRTTGPTWSTHQPAHPAPYGAGRAVFPRRPAPRRRAPGGSSQSRPLPSPIMRGGKHRRPQRTPCRRAGAPASGGDAHPPQPPAGGRPTRHAGRP